MKALNGVLTYQCCTLSNTYCCLSPFLSFTSLQRSHGSHQQRTHRGLNGTLVIIVYWILTTHTSCGRMKRSSSISCCLFSLPPFPPLPLISLVLLFPPVCSIHRYNQLIQAHLEQKQSRDEIIISLQHGVNYPSADGFKSLNRPPCQEP